MENKGGEVLPFFPKEAERSKCPFCGEDIATWKIGAVHTFWHRRPECFGYTKLLAKLDSCRVF